MTWQAVLIAFLIAAATAGLGIWWSRKRDADSGAQQQRDADEQEDARLADEARKLRAELDRLDPDALRERGARWVPPDDSGGSGTGDGTGGR